MNCSGRVNLHRSIMQSEIWKAKPSTLKLFLYLVMRVNFKDVLTQERLFKRGELITSYDKMMEETQISRPTLAEGLKWLRDNGYIQLLPSQKAYTHIRIPNYDKYQFIPGESSDSEPSIKPHLTAIK